MLDCTHEQQHRHGEAAPRHPPTCPPSHPPASSPAARSLAPCPLAQTAPGACSASWWWEGARRPCRRWQVSSPVAAAGRGGTAEPHLRCRPSCLSCLSGCRLSCGLIPGWCLRQLAVLSVPSHPSSALHYLRRHLFPGEPVPGGGLPRQPRRAALRLCLHGCPQRGVSRVQAGWLLLHATEPPALPCTCPPPHTRPHDARPPAPARPPRPQQVGDGGSRASAPRQRLGHP